MSKLNYWMKNRDILVAGGAGFLGRHLVKRLAEGGARRVVVVDARPINPSVFDDSGCVAHVRSDINQWAPGGSYDVVYNLACTADPAAYRQSPVHVMETCSIGLMNLCKIEAYRFVQASTSEVYGDPPAHELPMKEMYRGNVSTIGDRACYDEGKRFAEAFLWNVRTRYEATRIARIHNTYGPGMSSQDGRLVPATFAALEDGDPPAIHGTGKQLRTFCYVDDMVNGLVALGAPKLLETDDEEDDFKIVNLCGHPVDRFTVEEVVKMIIKIHGSKLEASHYGNPSAYDPLDRISDCSEAKRLIGWDPKVRLQDGLARMSSMIKDWNNAPPFIRLGTERWRPNHPF